jgi:hypothetical protein
VADPEAYFTRTLKSCATFLSRWNGAHVEIAPLRWPPDTLQILLTVPGAAGNLVLTCAEPEWTGVPTSWDGADIVVTRESEGYRVVDRGASLDLVTPAIEVKENVKLAEPRRPPGPGAPATEPAFSPGQRVHVIVGERNRTPRSGTVEDRSWHHKHGCWYFHIRDDRGRKVSKRYAAEDLRLDE